MHTVKSILQKHTSKASILHRSAFFTVQLSHPYMTTGKTIALTAAAAKSLQSVPGLGISPGEGKGYPLQYSGLEYSMDCIVYGVTKSRTRVSDFHFHFTFTFSNVNISILLCKGSLGLAHLAKQKPYPVITNPPSLSARLH